MSINNKNLCISGDVRVYADHVVLREDIGKKITRNKPILNSK